MSHRGIEPAGALGAFIQHPDGLRHGYVVAQGAFATFNLVKMLPELVAAGMNVKAIAAVSEELIDRQPAA